MLMSFGWSAKTQAQQTLIIQAALNDKTHEISVKQQLVFKNEAAVALDTLYFFDWNHAYSDKNSPLAKRFSDEFSIFFHLAKTEDRGETKNISIRERLSSKIMPFFRKQNQIDIIGLPLSKPLQPNETLTLDFNYDVKLPNERFTKFGFHPDGFYHLKNCWILPMAHKNGFKTDSNLNLDDAEVAVSNIEIEFSVPKKLRLFSDLVETKKSIEDTTTIFNLQAFKKKNFTIWLDTKPAFQKFIGSNLEVNNGIQMEGMNDLQTALILDRVMKFSNEYVGKYDGKKIIVTQAEYDRNPIYGLNQLPGFLSPFDKTFIFEMQFLKTYLQAYLKEQLPIDLRREQWILDGIQIFVMMQYVEQFYPEQKMMGNIGKIGILKGYKLTQLDFNAQYQYFYELMLRKNLDQALNLPKDELIKFNEQIANKYKSGLNFNYLNEYLGNQIVQKSITAFAAQNRQNTSENKNLITFLEENSGQNLNWFMDYLVNSRAIADFIWVKTNRYKDSVSYQILAKNGVKMPVPIYRLKDKKVLSKEWIDLTTAQKNLTFSKEDVDRVAINYEQIVPEYNKRNNSRSISKPFNRPFKFNLIRDLEDPNFNQVLVTPSIAYNLYDGISPGLRLHNKAILDKPFNFDVTPTYSTITQSLIGNMNFTVNDFRRDSRLHHIRYHLSVSSQHYAPDAAYYRLNPIVTFRIREDQFRDNHRQLIFLRSINIYREPSPFAEEITENYSVFNARYINSFTEMTRHFSFAPDVQFSNLFGKISGEMEYRKLFNNNRQFNIRWYGGLFMYRNTHSQFFDFGLDRPTDYLFDLPLLGRSEASGLFSQQFIMSEGGFKSKLDQRFANQFLTTLNTSGSIWNWIEAYADVGLLKNHNQSTAFVFDSGIRLNLVTDYFELYFPVYSSNGWEIGQQNYNERIRFVVTLNPKILTNLFTRKWF